MTKQVIRFGISDGSGHRAATWRLWTPSGKSDVYLACRELKGTLKASLHEEGSWHVAYSVAEELRPYGVDPASVAVLGNAADTSLFHPQAVNPPAASAPYFLTAGRLAPRKGLEDLITCAEIVRRVHPEAAFWIAGDGPLEAALRRQIARRGLDGGVRLLGHVASREALAGLYRSAVAYIHPAHYEGLPTVLIEAMACGCPVIATAVSGALDVIADGRNGLLAPSHAPQALAQAALALLEDAALAQRLGRAAHETAAGRYSWEAVGQAYLDEYRRLLGASQDASQEASLP